MNNFFVTIGPQLSKQNGDFKYVDIISRNCETFFFTDIDEMAKVIQHLKNKHSTGHDVLSNMMVKLCASVIMKLMVVCFNEMFSKETFLIFAKLPRELLYSKVEVSLILITTGQLTFFKQLAKFLKNLFTDE